MRLLDHFKNIKLKKTRKERKVCKEKVNVSCELNQLDDDETTESPNERDPSWSAERRDHQEQPSWCCNDAQSALARHIFLKSDSGC